MIEYRAFKNYDPPQIAEVWESSQLGRGAIGGMTSDILECFVFSQPYFDKNGLMVACDGNRMVGFVHAGFGANEERSQLEKRVGVICAVMVLPEYRRKGIGRELVKRAEDYLRHAGSVEIFAGPIHPFDPFYLGVYGGCQSAGFLASDENAEPFLHSLRYEAVRHQAITQRDLNSHSDPMSIRLMGVRRKLQMQLVEEEPVPNWWWQTRNGRLDTIRFELVPKRGGESVAAVSIVGLDFYLPKWQTRAVGLFNLEVFDLERRKGYGEALVLDVCRRLREERVMLVEAHIPQGEEATLNLFQKCGFEVMDRGMVYQKR